MLSFTLAALAALTLTSSASAAATSTTPLAQVCPYSGLCYSLSIPNTTATTGHGDIFFQIRASKRYQWAALGQGTGMLGANIFVIYQDATGKNVTVSPRIGVGHSEPLYDSRADIELLEGSGVEGDDMVANVRCGDCDAWASGHMDFTKSGSSWIYAAKVGTPLKSDDVEAGISKHDKSRKFLWDMSAGKGGADVNPFLTSDGRTTTPKPGDKDDAEFSQDGFVTQHLPKIHGALATLAFIVLFPLGGILIRLATFRGVLYIHAALQFLGYVFAIGAIASGIRLASSLSLFLNAHPIIGLILAFLLLGQPVYGFLHHRAFKATGRRGMWSLIHSSIGRILIFGAMINGGLGIMLAADVETNFIIAYAVLAALLGAAYIASIIIGARRQKRKTTTPSRNLRGDPSEDEIKLLNRGGGKAREGAESPVWARDGPGGTAYAPLDVGYADRDLASSRGGSRAVSPEPGRERLYDAPEQRGSEEPGRGVMS